MGFFLLITNCSGTDDIQAPHGIPVDLLDRILIIKLIPYGLEDMTQACVWVF